jgi:hypothetical protein
VLSLALTPVMRVLERVHLAECSRRQHRSHSGSARSALRWARGRRPPLARQGKLGHLLLLRHSGLAQPGEESDLEQGKGLWDSQIYGGGLQSGDA